MALGIFLVSFAVFATLRGTIFNNLWWVFTVTILATSLGLAIAVLADRARFESMAKSIIFLPMAISFVGAGIIWRFMYIARPPNKTQTGVMNALWVGLGKLSHSDGPRYIVVAVLLLIIVGLAYLGYRGWKAGAMGLLAGTIVTALPLLWMIYRFIGIPGLVEPLGLGGFTYTSAGELEAETILFLQTAPFNNVWLMVVLIWIQTGFTMVIFSAAIKGVPTDLIEAAKVDGATESQTFWRVVVPQIATTIGVVVTTLIVLVMKVFDIVKVMTNGNFDTQVLANEMWQRAFTEFNFGLGAAVAIVLFVSVLPVMYINIRRMQKAAA
jgi:alpha-glucoside transport system permease protein